MRDLFRNAILLMIMAVGATPLLLPAVDGAEFSLSDSAALRMEIISAFAFIALGSTIAIQGLWNWLRKDVANLPRLTFGQACGIVILFGILFVIAFTMLLGARELVTPGSWEESWFAFRLKDRKSNQVDPREQKLREAERQRLKVLAELLAIYAANHAGNYPESQAVAEIPPAYWLFRSQGEIHFQYVPGLSTADVSVPLAYSPWSDGGPVLVLLAGGEITQLDLVEIDRRVGARTP